MAGGAQELLLVLGSHWQCSTDGSVKGTWPPAGKHTLKRAQPSGYFSAPELLFLLTKTFPGGAGNHGMLLCCLADRRLGSCHMCVIVLQVSKARLTEMCTSDSP